VTSFSTLEGQVRGVRRTTRIGLLCAGLLAASSLAVWGYREPLLVRIGQLLIHSDAPRHADLIYVLAGDFWGSRVLRGCELGARGYAGHVLFGGGLYAGQYEGDMSVQFAVEHGYARQLFLAVPLRASSTIEEAIELGPVFRHLGARSVILVTSDYHSQRVDLVFRLFVSGIRFYTVAAPDKVFDVNSWWKTENGRRVFFLECRKMLGTLLNRVELLGSRPRGGDSATRDRSGEQG
jgi:uncharacterized SAM-binding protein YcdF (DUF218 family)